MCFSFCVCGCVCMYKCVRGQVSPHPLEISHYSFLLALWGPLSVPHRSLSNCLETWLEGTSSPDLSICMSLWLLKSLLKRGHMMTLCGELISDQFTHIFISGLLCFIWTHLFLVLLMRKWVGNTIFLDPETCQVVQNASGLLNPCMLMLTHSSRLSYLQQRGQKQVREIA